MKSVWVFLLAAVWMTACGRPQPAPSATRADSASTIVPVGAGEIRDRIESFRGRKAVLVNVWATWCAPCVEEFPAIVRIQKKYPRDLAVLFVSVDFPEQEDAVREFLDRQGVEGETYLKADGDDVFAAALSGDWTGAIPATMIYDRAGNQTAFWEGSATESEFEDEVLKALKTGGDDS